MSSILPWFFINENFLIYLEKIIDMNYIEEKQTLFHLMKQVNPTLGNIQLLDPFLNFIWLI